MEACVLGRREKAGFYETRERAGLPGTRSEMTFRHRWQSQVDMPVPSVLCPRQTLLMNRGTVALGARICLYNPLSSTSSDLS